MNLCQAITQTNEMAVKERKFPLAVFSNIFQKLKKAYVLNINEFINNATINGLQYIKRPDLTIVERFYFAVAFICAALSSIYFIGLVAQKWSYSPTIISINPIPSYIIDDPFPAVTICNLNQALKSKVEQLSKFSKEYAMIPSLCRRMDNSPPEDTLKDWYAFRSFTLNMSQSCERMLLQCSFGGVKYNCSHIFRQVLLDEGLCCTFNGLDPEFKFVKNSTRFIDNAVYPPDFKAVDWTVENGYQQPLPKYYYPMRSVGVGQSLGLNVILNVESEEYYCSLGNSVGFKMRVHDPEEEPNLHETGILLMPGAESYVRISPLKIFADEKMSTMNVKIRKCFFENEQNLTVFSHYTYANCLSECKVKAIRYRCGCEAAFLTSRNANITICNRKNQECLLNVMANEPICDERCLLSCYRKEYRVSVFSAKLETTGVDCNSPSLGNMSVAYMQKNIAIVKFFLKQSSYKSLKQAPYISSIEVLSSIGGLISIFFGFSFMSFVEIIYYICICPLRSAISKDIPKKETSWRKPCLRLANRPKTRFVNPYKQPTYTLKV